MPNDLEQQPLPQSGSGTSIRFPRLKRIWTFIVDNRYAVVINILLVANLVVLWARYETPDNMSTVLKTAMGVWFAAVVVLAEIVFIDVVSVGPQGDLYVSPHLKFHSTSSLVSLCSHLTTIARWIFVVCCTRLVHIGQPPPWVEMPTIINAGLLFGWAWDRLLSRNGDIQAAPNNDDSSIQESDAADQGSGQDVPHTDDHMTLGIPDATCGPSLATSGLNGTPSSAPPDARKSLGQTTPSRSGGNAKKTRRRRQKKGRAEPVPSLHHEG
ncbi:hypothetical protein EV356DRAFT_299782 [Viridothelium virens]|uniref:Uncharacterized protein n=1 Tax=Viridothelium virens TaxID=1048519 RepID=A0A6A6H0B8_VIRVR|nr:hypothetical protein EV356DRAFT_299782 [Viridothelium virens]